MLSGLPAWHDDVNESLTLGLPSLVSHATLALRGRSAKMAHAVTGEAVNVALQYVGGNDLCPASTKGHLRDVSAPRK